MLMPTGYNNKRWGQHSKVYLDKASKESKTLGFHLEYGVFKIIGHGDDRHSKNGFCIPTGKVCWLYWVFNKSGILQRIKQALHG